MNIAGQAQVKIQPCCGANTKQGYDGDWSLCGPGMAPNMVSQW